MKEKICINGSIVEVDTNEESVAPSLDVKIAILKSELAESDYKAIKFAEGVMSAEEYAPIKAERQRIRERINELEDEIANR